jgi:bifunctional UDP-N-acetylglucosamine pyrophosphorylase / glucosamine-1-phosphate N-acetyltransferase
MSTAEASEPPGTRLAVVVLAAGQGTRMRSPLPKVLHPVAGRPMIQHVLGVARELDASETVVVVSPRAPDVRAGLGEVPVVEQAQQLGTGHAVLQARAALAERSDEVLILYGDGPLIRAETLRRLRSELGRATISLLSVKLPNPTGYGRILRDESGDVVSIVEEAVADESTRAISEVWSGQMAIVADWLWLNLPDLPIRPNGEYYLTDLVERAHAAGLRVAAVRAESPAEAMGINTQAELAQANRVAWDRVTARLMAEGVTVLDPATTYVEAGVVVGEGTVIHPNSHLQGATHVGRRCNIGPDSTIVDSTIGDDTRVWASVVEGSELEAAVEVGPFSHVRPGCHIERDVRLGNYAETKASRIGRGTQVHHFSYLGDARVGQRVNVGAGTITCNYDGQQKHRTTIGDDAFVGSDSLLVAPVSLGDRARTGAGSVVTRDVPDDTSVVGVPARPIASRHHVKDSSRKDGE